MKQSEKEERQTEREEWQGLIATVELALDWNLPISEEEYEKYLELIKK